MYFQTITVDVQNALMLLKVANALQIPALHGKVESDLALLLTAETAITIFENAAGLEEVDGEYDRMAKVQECWRQRCRRSSGALPNVVESVQN